MAIVFERTIRAYDPDGAVLRAFGDPSGSWAYLAPDGCELIADRWGNGGGMPIARQDGAGLTVDGAARARPGVPFSMLVRTYAPGWGPRAVAARAASREPMAAADREELEGRLSRLPYLEELRAAMDYCLPRGTIMMIAPIVSLGPGIIYDRKRMEALQLVQYGALHGLEPGTAEPAGLGETAPTVIFPRR